MNTEQTGLLAVVGELVVGDEGDVAHQGADVGRPARRAERLLALGEEGRVGGGEVLPLGGYVILVEDGLHRADWLAAPQSTHLIRVI